MVIAHTENGRLLRTILYSIVTFIIVIALLEGICRVAESIITSQSDSEEVHPGWQTTFFQSLFEWNEPDPYLLWRFKPNLNNRLIKTNSRGLIGNEISSQKAEGTYRIMILGDSSPVGIGLDSRAATFGEVLKRLLGASVPDSVHVELINAAVTGYSSEQIVRFMDREGWAYQPDLVILYCGNNDASVSGVYSDIELFGQQRFQAIRAVASHTAIYRVVRSLLKNLNTKPTSSGSNLCVRVTPERYGHNIERLLSECQKHGCPLIALTPPVPYLWPAALQFKVFSNVSGKSGELILPPSMLQILGREFKYCLDDQLFAELYGTGDKFSKAVYHSAFDDSLPPEEAITYWNNRILSEGLTPVLLNNLGVSCWEAGQYDIADSLLRKARDLYVRGIKDRTNVAFTSAGSPFLYNIGINLLTSAGNRTTFPPISDLAQNYLDSALEADYFSLRFKKAYRKQIEKLTDQENVFVLDLQKLFHSNKDGEKLFVDHCHPTTEGHLIIARELSELIREHSLLR